MKLPPLGLMLVLLLLARRGGGGGGAQPPGKLPPMPGPVPPAGTGPVEVEAAQTGGSNPASWRTSRYHAIMGALASVHVVGAGQSTNLGGYATVSSDGSWSLDGAINKAIDGLDASAPDFVKKLEAGAIAGAATYAAVTATVAEAASAAVALGVDAAAVAAFSAAIPVVGLAVAVIAGLLAAYGAGGGPGCCGTQKLTEAQARAILKVDSFGNGTSKATDADVQRLVRFGSCDPSNYLWTSGVAGYGSYTVPTSPAEAFVSNMVRASFERMNDCWGTLPQDAYGASLALGAAVWNKTHSSSKKLVIKRRVNVVKASTFAGHPTTSVGAQDNEPISVAMQQSASRLPQNAVMSLTLNVGPALATAPTKSPAPTKLPPVGVTAPSMTAAQMRDVALSVLAHWSLVTADGTYEYNSNASGARTDYPACVWGGPYFVTKTGLCCAYSSLGDCAMHYLALLETCFKDAHEELFMQPTGGAWFVALTHAGYGGPVDVQAYTQRRADVSASV